jgi:hypothetical protein
LGLEGTIEIQTMLIGNDAHKIPMKNRKIRFNEYERK